MIEVNSKLLLSFLRPNCPDIGGPCSALWIVSNTPVGPVKMVKMKKGMSDSPRLIHDAPSPRTDADSQGPHPQARAILRQLPQLILIS